MSFGVLHSGSQWANFTQVNDQLQQSNIQYLVQHSLQSHLQWPGVNIVSSTWHLHTWSWVEGTVSLGYLAVGKQTDSSVHCSPKWGADPLGEQWFFHVHITPNMLCHQPEFVWRPDAVLDKCVYRSLSMCMVTPGRVCWSMYVRMWTVSQSWEAQPLCDVLWTPPLSLPPQLLPPPLLFLQKTERQVLYSLLAMRWHHPVFHHINRT